MSREPVCHIAGAGEPSTVPLFREPGDWIIGADGGYRWLRDQGLQPDLVVGDFDSLGAPPSGEQVVLLPRVKDVTDTWAAVEEGIQRGFRRFFLYGCTGGRFEHTLANLQTAASLAERGMECIIYHGEQVITALSGGAMAFHQECTGFLSVFSHTNACRGVTIRGMKYQLEKAELSNRFPLGVSNEFTGQPGLVEIAEGTAILVFDRRCRFDRIQGGKQKE